ncbi:MAG: PAS-domain containing protein [Alphaproteobacteria bacterium]|nr:PAS-domain containing protein [Alphaproteobacteria bacterium]MBU4052477.1 PAS-domain containing protein [Alphaproteobacteria bacterium]MBU4156502.1 PAS-domain containing protein [Alphaproteobacteria bacterium]
MNTGGDLLNLACEKIAELEVPAFIKDSELRYVAVNGAYAAFFREKPEAFAGKTDRELFGRLEDGVRDDRERQVIVFGDEQTTLVFDPYGQERYPLRLERFFGDDDAIYVFGLFDEAPSRVVRSKRSAARAAPKPVAVENPVDLFHATLEDLPVATYVRDADHRMAFVNRAFVEMVGVSKDALIGKTEHECFPARGDEYYQANCRTLEEGVASEQEDVFRREDGVVVPVISRASRIEMANGDRYMVGSITDISLLKNREAQLIEAQNDAEGLHQHVESLLRSMPVGILILGADYDIEYANDAFYDMLEAEAPIDMTGWHYRDFLAYNVRRGGSQTVDADVDALFNSRVARFADTENDTTSRAETMSGRILAIRSKRLDTGKILITYSDITALHQREQESVLYRTAIEQLPVPVFIRDSERRLIFANSAYGALQGGEREKFYGLTEEQMFPRSGQQLREDNLHLLETGESVERSQELPMAGGRIHSVITSLGRIITPDEQRYIVGSITDVSLLKARERELVEAQARAQKLYADLENILRIMPVGVIILNEDLVIEFANSKSHEIWEWPEDRLLEGTTFREYAKTNQDRGWAWEGGKEFEPGLEDRVAEMRALEGTIQRELVYPDGKQVLITTTPLVDRKFLVTYSDFTEVRRREREISEAREQLERLGQFMQDATRVMAQGLVFIEDGVILQSNEALASILNVPPMYLEPGQSWHACFAYCAKRGDFGDQPMAELKKWQDRILSHQSFSEVFLADGKTWVQLEATVSRRGHWMLLYSDITDIKAREGELTELLARSEAADKAKSEFLANMSHEIRTPMNGVLGMAELLAKSSLDTRQKTFVDIIVKSGNALLTIINDILDFSKIDAGQLKLRKVPFDPVEAIEDVATLLSASAAEKDIELIVCGDVTVRHMVSGDPGRFRQIVTNLVGNAIKFTEKGHVLIELSSTPSDGSQVMLSMRIEDTGIGIPEDKRASIFEKFSQVDTSSTRRHEGTGLGLAITAGLVDLFGGHIDVESTIGEGSVFTVHVPFTVANERQRPQPLPVNVEGARVLVIDDNEINRRILTEQLELWGFDGVAVESGHAAMAVLEEAHRIGVSIDALIVDYQMPVMNGLDVARMIRADRRFESIAMIFLTSMDMVGDERIFQQLNVQAHLMKPARANLLRSAIVDVVRAARLSRPIGMAEPAARPASAAAIDRRSLTAPAGGSPSPRPPSAARRNSPMPARSGCDVLVAEDNEVNQIVFRQILQSTDLSHRIVGNGREAIVAWRAHNPRLILMDVSMPILNGHQAARTIREAEKAEGEGRHVPIIGVTTHALDSDREACLAAGMDDYLSKPISPEQLEAKIERWLGHSLRDGSVLADSGH